MKDRASEYDSLMEYMRQQKIPQTYGSVGQYLRWNAASSQFELASTPFMTSFVEAAIGNALADYYSNTWSRRAGKRRKQ